MHLETKSENDRHIGRNIKKEVDRENTKESEKVRRVMLFTSTYKERKLSK